jgi:carboxyl-terminal processing protease
VVKQIIPGGAADKQGELKVEDKIVGVGEGAEGELVDTVEMKLKNVVKMIRGKQGTDVRLEVVPGDGSKRKVIKITRAKIELKDSEARAEIFEAGRKADDQAYKVGVIDLPSFYMDMERARNGVRDFKSTTRDVRRILDDFNQKGVDAVVLDLRRNGGGSLSEAIHLTGLFIDEGPVVQVKDGDDQVQPYHDLDPGTAWSGPLVVLTSKFSASASEILAGAVQDYNRGLIVGDHATHGKGTVQSLTDLGQKLFGVPNSPQMGALKITMQQFYRPKGESTQKQGVLADVELPSLTTHLDVGEADLDFPVDFDKVEPQRFKRLNYVDQAVRDRLRYLSEQRRGDSEDFQKVLKNIDRYKEQKARKHVTLNEEKFLKERAELNAEKQERETLEGLNDPQQQPIKRDYYLNEALAITVDYLNHRQVAKAN